MAGKNDRTIKTTLSLDGKSDYVKGIGQISAELRSNKSALELLDEQYKDNTESLDYLAQREDLLNQRLDLNNAKVAAVEKSLESKRKAEEKAAQVVDENTRLLDEKKKALAALEQAEDKNAAAIADARKAVEYQSKVLENSEKKYDSAAAAVANMQNRMNGAEKEVAQTTNAMRASGDAAGGLGENISALAGKLGIDLPEGLTSAMNGMEGLDAGVMAASAGTIALAVAIYKVVEALFKLTIGQAQAADEMATLSQRCGLSTETLQELSYAEELIDVDTGTLTGSMAKLTRSMDDAKTKGSDASDAFETLRVRVTGVGGKLRSTEDVFNDTIDALGRIQNQAERDALSMQIFGKSATDLNPMILQGSDTLRKYAEEAHNVGYILSEEDSAALLSLDDSMQRFKLTLETVGKKVGAELAPSFELLVSTVGEGLVYAINKAMAAGALDMIVQIVEIVAELFELLEPLMDLIGPAFTAQLKIVTGALAVVNDALTLIVSTISLLVNHIKALFELIGNGKVSDSTSKAIQSAYDGFGKVFSADGATASYVSDLFSSTPGYANGIECHPGGLAKVGERGWEYAILPRGTRVIPHAQSVAMAARGVPAYAAGTGGGGTTVNLYLQGADIDEIKRIVDYYKSYPTSRRKG